MTYLLTYDFKIKHCSLLLI